MIATTPPPCVGSTPAIREILTDMWWARDIHAHWAAYLAALPKKKRDEIAKVAGTVAWQIKWVGVYNRSMDIICGLDAASTPPPTP